ncbi:MAG: hypothetical protein O2860_09605 [Chloroflexi bacterium]|nr:hypothetical protein [Chloroflexota bacterium]
MGPPSVTAHYDWYKAALTLARLPNIYIKFGGLGEFRLRPQALAAQFTFPVYFVYFRSNTTTKYHH